LVTEVLLPIAKDGLNKAGISQKDSERYLKIIYERTKTGKSGSQWMIDSAQNMKNRGTKEEKMIALTAGMAKRQKTNRPVHRWGLAKIDEAGSWINRYWRIDQIMTREVYTVNQNDLIDLVPNVMNWQNIRHVVVENEKGSLVGLLTSGTLVSHYSACLMSEKHPSKVKQIMIKNPITIQEDALTKDAISLMRKHKIGCLPVLNKKKELVGIVTEHDFVNVADHFLQEFLKEYDAGGNGDSNTQS
jgi:predicted transcriptional regulator